jgi:hypothetical protein
MSTAPDLDARIESLTEAEYATPGEALAAATETAALISDAITAEHDRAETFTGFGPDLSDRLKRWIDKLEKRIKRIAHQFGALSYTLTVGWPWGVQVSVTWAPSS